MLEFCAITVVQVCINNARNISFFLKQSPFKSLRSIHSVLYVNSALEAVDLET